jgi:glycosyltransferase involved in cell wall biosynthesis
MRIAFIARSSLFRSPGGDTIQILSTSTYLKRLGLDVDIKLTTEAINYSTYDLLHFFNIIRPADILSHIQYATCPFVVSTIFVEYKESDKMSRTGITGSILRNVSSLTGEYMKTLGRWVASGEQIVSKEFLWRGQERSIKKIISKAACLFMSSMSEYERLRSSFGGFNCFKIIPNGVDAELFSGAPRESIRQANLVLCVARIEAVKNQVNLIKAVRDSRFKLKLIGTPAPHQRSYYQKCRAMASSNVAFMDHVSQEELVPLYAKAKVHVLPSWFETTGLSSLEAAAMGCNVVISTRGDSKEYFGDFAYYCEPDQPASILQAIEDASNAEFNRHLQERILSEFTWEQAALKTVDAYKQVLKL